MPAQFSGIFYVNEIIERDLHCYFYNDRSDTIPIKVTYFYNRSIADSAPSPYAYTKVERDKVYLFHGNVTFSDGNFNAPLVTNTLLLQLKLASSPFRLRVEPFQFKLRL